MASGQQVLDLLLDGCDNRDIAASLHIAERTVKAHLARLFLHHGITRKVKRVELAVKLFAKPAPLVATSVQLNQRDLAIVSLVAKAWTNREIADTLGTSEHVIKNYLRTLYDMIGVWNRVELALWVVSHFTTGEHDETAFCNSCRRCSGPSYAVPSAVSRTDGHAFG